MSDQLPSILVARYLKAHHFTKTLTTFLSETNLPPSLATTNPGDWTLETLVTEKIQFDKSLNFEKTPTDQISAWTTPSPSKPHELMSTNVNVLNVNSDSKTLSVTTADNACMWLDTKFDRVGELRVDSPILSTVWLGDMMAFTTMSGKLALAKNGQVIAERRDHSKWVVKAVAWEREGIVATAGWDRKVNIYRVGEGLEEPVQRIGLESNPEGMVFVQHPDTGAVYLVLSRRDSSFLYYYRLEDGLFLPAGRQNLAPHSNAWVAFTPSALALHPSDRTLLAVGTSHLPHMKVMIVRLLFPDADARVGGEVRTVASTARADLALQDREDAAITLQVSVQAPQTPYSTPQVVWRPDGSGLWTNGDDGVIRGVEAKTGKVVVWLRGHEVGSKVRTLWAGILKGADGSEAREVLISGGFDKKVFVWEIDR